MTPSGTVTGRALGSATPYPWPYHDHFDPGRSALVACLDARWRVPSRDARGCDIKLEALAQAVRLAGGMVVLVRQTPMRPVAARVPSIEAPPLLPAADITVLAGGTSAFYASNLDDLLRRAGRTDLILAGWGLEGPVHSTMRAANDRGYECLLVPDASTSVDPVLTEAACSMVQFSGGIFGAWAPTDDVLEFLDEFACSNDVPLSDSLTPRE